MTKKEKAVSLFKDGYNCAQAVVGAFEEEINIGHSLLMSLSSSFGGGMGRLREVCGTVTGAFIVLGAVFGYDDPKAPPQQKASHYKHIQEFAKRFEAENGSYICRELLGLEEKKPSDHVPEARTESYYAKRPCAELCGVAAEILEKLIEEIKSNEI